MPVLKGDSATDLKDRILIEEHTLFVQTLQAIAEDRVQLIQGQERAQVLITPSSLDANAKSKQASLS